jgi:hypothetical protein
MSMNYLYAQMQAKGREVLTTTAPDREKTKILPKLLGEPRERGKEEVTKIHGEPERTAARERAPMAGDLEDVGGRWRLAEERWWAAVWWGGVWESE